MPLLAVSVIGTDRPGIAAAVTKVLLAAGCNLEDSANTILRGHFAMMLVVQAPESIDSSGLERALAEPTAGQGLMVAVREITAELPATVIGSEWVLEVYGADQPGLVHNITAVLAEAGVNIAEMSTRLVGSAGPPIYVLTADVTVPPSVDPAALEEQLVAVAVALGVDCHLDPAEEDLGDDE